MKKEAEENDKEKLIETELAKAREEREKKEKEEYEKMKALFSVDESGSVVDDLQNFTSKTDEFIQCIKVSILF